MPVILAKNGKVDLDTRGLVFYSKEESVRKIETHLDVEVLQQNINVSSTEWSGSEWARVEWNYSGMRGLITKWGTTLASARALYLDLLSCVWLHISGGLNCCQEFRRGVV